MGNKSSKRAPKHTNDEAKQIEKAKEESPPLLDETEELDKKWKEFYSSTIAKFHRHRPKFIFLGSLAKSYRVRSIENQQFGYWYKDDNMVPKCDSVFADFSICFSLTHNDCKVNLKLTALFNNKKYKLFDDNFATKVCVFVYIIVILYNID